MTETPDPLAHPAVNPETRPWWEALAQGRLLIRRCADCGAAHHYPRTHCPFCRSANTGWQQAAGKGTVYAYTVMRRETPVRIVAYVTLDEGATMFTNIIGCAPEAIRIGTPVLLHRTTGSDGLPLATFTPA
jgi:uncharacterized OB-fold protein